MSKIPEIVPKGVFHFLPCVGDQHNLHETESLARPPSGAKSSYMRMNHRGVRSTIIKTKFLYNLYKMYKNTFLNIIPPITNCDFRHLVLLQFIL